VPEARRWQRVGGRWPALHAEERRPV